MATIAKFYLHDAATPNTGTMPGAGDAFLRGGDATGDAIGARTARAADATIGTFQTSSVITSNADTNAQTWGHRRFVSPPLAATTLTFTGAPGNDWTVSYACSESNLNHNQAIGAELYAWRPSTGLRVGTGDWTASGPEPTVASTEQAISFNGNLASSGGDQAILDGDILVIEIWTFFTQGMSTAYTDTFFYDGTTEASTTSCASFVTPPAALTLYTTDVLIPVSVSAQFLG